jgi:glycosyltransferase involved in cell wall biosynthesis
MERQPDKRSDRQRLIVYDDSAVFGGHEAMMLEGLQAILEAGVEVLFVYATENGKLREALDELMDRHPRLSTGEQVASSRKLQGIRNRFEGAQVTELAERFRRFGAPAVMCAQGDLELSSRGLLAAKKAGLRAVSYIPYAHTQADMGATCGRFRDLFNGYLLQVPDAFITVSRDAAEHFSRRGSKVPVHVVYNGIDVEKFGGDREQAREKLGLRQRGHVIALCGRLERKQKGQPLLLAALSSSRWLRENVTALLVGDGPDEGFLRHELGRLGLADSVRFEGWSDPTDVYPALDVLVVASRFEGMPLVMLEAIASGVPVVASDRDGMRELLPRDWRFRSGSAVELAERLEAVLKNPPQQEVASLAARIRDEMSLGTFRDRFSRIVIDQCGLAP